MAPLMEISGIDYSQGLPTPDGAGDLGADPADTKWLWVGLGAAAVAGALAFFWFRRK